MHTITDSVHEIQLEYVRTFVLETNDTVTLIDTGFERTADTLVAALQDEFNTIDRIILTHAGGDHYGGLNAVMDAFDPELYAAVDETNLLDAIEFDPDVLFEHGDVLEGGIEIIQVPGHTPCPSALLLRDERVLISGDVLDGADRRGLPKEYLLPPPEVFNHDHAAAERNLNTLLDYDFDTVLVFHGSHVTDNPRAKLERYLDFKDHYRQELLDT